MSLRRMSHRTSPDDTTGHLEFAVDFITRSALAKRLAVSVSERADGAKRGRKQTRVPYTALAIACIVYEIVASGRPYTIVQIFKAIWYRYTDEQLRLIGLDGIRTAQRVADLNPPADASLEEQEREKKAIDAEYQRLWQAIRTLFAAMEDTPLVANRSKANRPTEAEVKAAKMNAALAEKTKRKHEVLNGLIAAGLIADNERRNPGTTLHGKSGILEDHEGHWAGDETHLAVGAWGLPKGVAPGNYLARTHAHGKIYKGAPSLIGLTLGVAVARPSQPHDVPNVCLGAAIHHPTGGLGAAILDIADAIEANGLRAPQRSNINQQVIGDGAYTQADGLNQGLTNRRYGIVVKYKKNQRTLHEFQSIRHDDGTITPGIRLFNGSPLCPGASMHVLTRTHLQVPDFYDRKKDDGTPNPLDGEELVAREEALAKVLPYRMSTSGRPVEVEVKKPGGQTKGARTGERAMRVTLTCPHVKGTARCAIFSEYDDPEIEHLPPVPAPPVHLAIDKRPSCCVNDSGTIQARIPLWEYKDWQEFMPGTWEHADWYTGPRAANERYNARLKETTSGGSNLNRNSIGPRKAAMFALFTAMAIVNANRIAVESWYETLDDNRWKNATSVSKIKPPIKPAPKAHENKARRERAHKRHLERMADRGPRRTRAMGGGQ